jgi:hypothetical protein
MPSSSYPAFPLLHILFLLHLPPKGPSSIPPALSAISRSVSASSAVYPPNHPSIAIAHAEHAKFLFALATEDWTPATLPERLKRVEEAQGRLVDAVRAANVGFGRRSGGGLVGREMKGLVERCEVEKAGIRGEMEMLRHQGRKRD